MAKQIIILDKLDNGRYRYALWATVPVARQAFYANASAKSIWKDAGASELTALQNGSVVEFSDVLAVDGLTIGQAETQLQAAFTAFQTAISNNNPWLRYGSFFDGTSWTAGGVS